MSFLVANQPQLLSAKVTGRVRRYSDRTTQKLYPLDLLVAALPVSDGSFT
jgi:hypothetical protein